MNPKTDPPQSPHSLAATQPSRYATVIAVAAGQRGTGKTSLAVNLAVSLASGGKRVCLLDPDTRHDGATQLLGGRTDISLDAFLTDRIELEQVMQAGAASVGVISAPSALNARNQGQISIMRTALQRLEQDQDYLIINTPAHTETPSLEILGAAQHVLISLLPDLESIKSSYSLAWSLVRQGFQGSLHVVVNKVGDRTQARSAYRQFKKITERRLGINVRSLGYVVRDNQLHDAFYHRAPVTLRHPKARSTRCFQGITEMLKQRFAQESPPMGFGDRWYNSSSPAATTSIVVKLPPRMEDKLSPDERFDRLFERFTAFVDEGGVSEERLRLALVSLENQYEALFKQPRPAMANNPAATGASQTIARSMEQLTSQSPPTPLSAQHAEIEGVYHALESAALLAEYEYRRFAAS